MDSYTILKYIRLSTDDSYSDSQSIENQRLLLDKYIADMDIPNVTALELVDNGYSGTNFERPAVQELFDLVRAGKINCIVVKDFSRFGRNAIETGYLLERVFPLFRTRFISVCDNYDSDAFAGGTGGIEVALKFLVHEQYSLDLSRKIKAAKAEKARRGEYITKNCVFGYVKSEDNRLDIDSDAADTVRLIFALASEGKRTSEIAQILYEQKHLTPAAYKKRICDKTANVEYEYIWSASTLLTILRDEQYIGTYIAGKTRVADVGSRSTVRVAESEWMCKIPCHHPAIVTEDLFAKVQNIINGRRKPKNRIDDSEKRGSVPKQFSPLKGKTVCGCCGHVMAQSSANNAVFRCNFTRSAPDAECHGLSINSEELEKVIFEIISKQTQIALGVDNLSEVDAATLKTSQQTECRRSIERLHDTKLSLYERYTLGEISADEYRGQKAVIDAEIDRLNRAYAVITERITKQKREADARAILSEAVSGAVGITQSMVQALIERVLVYPDKSITIQWKIADKFDS